MEANTFSVKLICLLSLSCFKARVLCCRLESYSCKLISEEKRQFKQLINRLGGPNKEKTFPQKLGPSQTLRQLHELTGQPINPSAFQMSNFQDQFSPVKSPAAESATSKKRTWSESTDTDDSYLSSSSNNASMAPSLPLKDFFVLIGTLNCSFGPEYDFSMARSDEFCLEPELSLVKLFIAQFCSIYVDKYVRIAPRLWNVLEQEIVPDQCVIYSYRPDRMSDPYSSGCLASFNYLFHNRVLRRVLFFSLRVLNEPIVLDQDECEFEDLY